MSEKKVPIDCRLGAALKKARRSRGIPQWQLAETLGFEQSTVGRWETGVRPMRLAQLVQACQILGVDPVQIFAEALPKPGEDSQ